MRVYLLAGALALTQAALAVPHSGQLVPRASDTTATATSTASSSVATCSGNSATDRSAWCDYDLSTNWYDEAPDTGVTREYYLELTETTVDPDGYSRFGVSFGTDSLYHKATDTCTL